MLNPLRSYNINRTVVPIAIVACPFFIRRKSDFVGEEKKTEHTVDWIRALAGFFTRKNVFARLFTEV